jgi:hypothetical protein
VLMLDPASRSSGEISRVTADLRRSSKRRHWLATRQ